jgi:antitoxin component YwqK of YwqJK toxin-antitoxin module
MTKLIKSAVVVVVAILSCSSCSKAPSGDCPDGAALRGQAPPEGNLQWCAKSNGIKHGKWVEWYPDGTLKTKGQYVNGKMEGTWVTYHQMSTTTLADGDAGPLPQSPVKKQEGAYEKGVKKGNWTLYYEDAKVNRLEKHSPESNRIAWSTWRPTGEKWAEGTIVKLLNHGQYREWHKNGRLAIEGAYHRGDKEGEWNYWNSDGTPAATPQGDFDLVE